MEGRGVMDARALIVGALVAVVVGAAPAAEATVPIAEWNDGEGRFELAGYVRSTSGVHDLGYGEPLFESTRGFNAAVGRVQWLALLGPDVELEVHQELLWTLTPAAGSDPGGDGSSPTFGIGATREAKSTVDLQSTFVDASGARLTHDIDRLAATFYTDAADVTVGRQAITWGRSNLFPVADLWTRFSPFDLDTLQKPGIDAARALVYPSMSTELDVVVADRGSLEHLSGAVRGATTVDATEVWLAGGKFWGEVLAMGGFEYVFDRVKLRAEGVAPWHLDRAELDLPRATAGVEWFGLEFTAGAEYHFNGIGVEAAEEYVDQTADQQFRRGESYFLGRHYAGVYGSYAGITDLELSLSMIGNVGDPSLVAAPTVRYQIAQNTTLGAGSFVSAGETPELRPMPRFRSEFGAYGNFYFLELTAHY